MEELIIRVKIDGFQGGAEEGGSGGQGVGGAAGLGIAAGIAARNNSLPQVAAKATFKGAVRAEKKLIRKFNKHGFHGVLAEDIDTELLSQRQGIFTLNTEIRAQLIGAPRGTIMDYTTRQFQGSLAHEFLMQERAKFTPQVMRAAAGAAAWKTISAGASISQHRSGDSYYNQQLQNGIKLAGYAATFAMSGPFAPVVAAGIVINESINHIVNGINFNYDRNMEGRQITNIKLLAGDVSYGRNRGGV